MKKILVCILIILSITLFSACSQSNYYSLKITGSKDFLISSPRNGKYKAGRELIIKSDGIHDASLYVFVNGEKIISQYIDDCNVFKFYMPECNTVVHITFDQFYGKDTYTFGELFYWHDTVTLDSVKEIKLSTRNSSDSLRTFINNIYTSDSRDIVNILSIFNQKLVKFDEKIESNYTTNTYYFIDSNDYILGELMIIGEKVYYYDFSTSQKFSFEDSNYLIPKIQYSYKNTFKFQYSGTLSKIYRNNGNNEIIHDRKFGIDLFEFIEIESDFSILDAKYYLEGENGIQYIINENTFIFEDKCYLIIGEYNFNYYNLDFN